jgi:regulator of sirC expression with transglutaminase-like and TPR domain
MPVLYIAVGRRLGYPLYLVQAREHFFVRWEVPHGERFNIEATALGFVPRDDEHFRRWPKPIRDEELRQGLFLQNLSPQEELAAFLRERGQCWLDHLRTRPALESFAEAARLNPRLPGIDCALAIGRVLHRAVERYGREALFAVPAAELRLPPAENPWDSQVLPLALQELRRVVTNYQQRQRDRLMRNQTVSCQF